MVFLYLDVLQCQRVTLISVIAFAIFTPSLLFLWKLDSSSRLIGILYALLNGCVVVSGLLLITGAFLLNQHYFPALIVSLTPLENLNVAQLISAVLISGIYLFAFWFIENRFDVKYQRRRDYFNYIANIPGIGGLIIAIFVLSSAIFFIGGMFLVGVTCLWLFSLL